MAKNGIEFKVAGHKGTLGTPKDGKYPFRKDSTGNVVMLPEGYVKERLKREPSSVHSSKVTLSNQGVK